MRYTYTDKVFFNNLFLIEVMSENCRKEGCSRKRIRNSSMCPVHHFEMIKGKACPWEHPIQLPTWPFRRIVKTLLLVIGIAISVFLAGCIVTSLWISLEALRLFGSSVFFLALAFVLSYIGSLILERTRSPLIEGPFGAVVLCLGFWSFTHSIHILIRGVWQLIHALTS